MIKMYKKFAELQAAGHSSNTPVIRSILPCNGEYVLTIEMRKTSKASISISIILVIIGLSIKLVEKIIKLRLKFTVTIK